MENKFTGDDRRQFVRLDFVSPLAVKVCKPETITKLLNGYTSNVSQSGILCHLKECVHKDDILWLSFDRSTLILCEELERQSLIYQSGIIGKVVRVENEKEGEGFSVGVQFITRQEQNLSHVYPDIHFALKDFEHKGHEQK